ncbi:zinc transporter ZIP1-like [Haematobia irritans]|uniref:zinc transporter ZIP1-like n=1 Tax=Haematobia irritans TaxID=7368 RepID=UPI003F50C3D1
MNLSQSFDLIWPKLRTFNDGMSTYGTRDGVAEKSITMVVLCVGSYLFGMLPALMTHGMRLRFPLVTTLMLCFGAGVLLATSLIHILPEVREQMDSNWAEISLCGGLLLIYFIEELVHYFVGSVHQHTQHDSRESGNRNYEVLNNESEDLPSDPHNNENISITARNASNGGQIREEIIQQNNQATTQSISSIGLLVALSVHSAIEGIAIGVQDTPSKVLFLLGAISCHKFVMAFCLGLELSSRGPGSLKGHLIGISVFAFGGVCGIALGMLLVDIPCLALSVTTLAVVQGLAGGTLLYVTICEVIPREKVSWHENPSYKMAGLGQCLTVAVGFTAMTLVSLYLSDEDGRNLWKGKTINLG